MRILQVVEASLAGVGSHVLDLAEGLLARDHDVHLVYSPRRQDRFFRHRIGRLQNLRAWPVDLRRRPHPSDFTGVQAVRRALREEGPFDVIHGHSSKGGAVARLAALTAGIPAVYTPHAVRTMDPTMSSLTRIAVGSAERLLASVSVLIAVSPREAEHLLRMGIPRERLRVVLNCIRPTELPTASRARSELGLPLDAWVVGFVGRLTTQKAPEVLLSAFYRVVQFVPEALLVIIGDGPLRRPLQRACEQLGLDKHVRWMGERNGQRSMPAFDVMALPSRYEGLPQVLLEALHAGLPIVATEEASAGLIVEPGVNGLVVPVDDPDAVADAILYMLTHDRERESFAWASRYRAARFTQDRMVEETEQVYREVVIGRPGEESPTGRKEKAWREERSISASSTGTRSAWWRS